MLGAMDARREDAYCDGYERKRVNTLKAAELAGVSERTIYNWVRRGIVEFVRTPTGGVRIYVDTLLRRGE